MQPARQKLDRCRNEEKTKSHASTLHRHICPGRLHICRGHCLLPACASRPESECNKIVIVSPPRGAWWAWAGRACARALPASVGNRVFFLFHSPISLDGWNRNQSVIFLCFSFSIVSWTVRRMTRTFSPIFGLNSISLNLKPEPRNRRVDEIKRKNIESGIRFIYGSFNKMNRLKLVKLKR